MNNRLRRTLTLLKELKHGSSVSQAGSQQDHHLPYILHDCFYDGLYVLRNAKMRSSGYFKNCSYNMVHQVLN